MNDSMLAALGCTASGGGVGSGVPSEVVVRAARPSDVEAVAALYAPMAEAFGGRPPTIDELRLRLLLAPAHAPWFVAVDGDDEVVGFVHARAVATRDGVIETNVFVRDAYRRKGIARRLYQALIGSLRKTDCRCVLATILLPNDASVALHESLGFEPVTVHDAAAWTHDGGHRAGWWQLRLAQR